MAWSIYAILKAHSRPKIITTLMKYTTHSIVQATKIFCKLSFGLENVKKLFFHPPWGLTQPPRKTLVQSHCFVTAQIFHGRSLWITKKGLILRYLKFYSSPFLLSTEPSNHKYFSFEHSWRDICRNDLIHYKFQKYKKQRNNFYIQYQYKDFHCWLLHSS